MTKTSPTELITDIGELTTQADGEPRRAGRAMVVQGGRIRWIGAAAHAPAADTGVSVGGRAVLPGWVDSHTHLLFAGDRSAEFEARMAGQVYTAGGIGHTVAATRAATDAAIESTVQGLCAEALAQGTTFLETKTGYGLDVDSERRAAAIGARHADVVSFLGAHVVPDGIETREYLDLVTGPMLEAVLPWVTFIDVFCERGAFDVEQSREVLLAGRAAGLGLRVHGNQLGVGGGIALAVELGAASVDHCNRVSPADLAALAGGSTVATLLPACDLSTRQPLAPARALLDAGVTVALATNCNPGTSYTTSMQFCVATAVLQMGLNVDEAVWAATRGGAQALRRDTGADAVGVLRVGGRADFQVLDAPSIAHLAYRPGVPLTIAVWQRGKRMLRPPLLSAAPR